MEKPYLVGITGCSGSGKTFFLDRLMDHFKPSQICLVSQDHYYIQREKQPRDEKGIKNFDTLESIDLDHYYRDIQALIRGEKVKKREYTYNNPGKKPGWLEFKPAPVIVLEGIFVLSNQKLATLLDLKIFIDAQDHIRLKRRIVRDNEERGYDLEDVLYRYQNHVIPTYRQFIEPYKSQSDIIIPNDESIDKALEVLVSHINLKIKA